MCIIQGITKLAGSSGCLLLHWWGHCSKDFNVHTFSVIKQIRFVVNVVATVSVLNMRVAALTMLMLGTMYLGYEEIENTEQCHSVGYIYSYVNLYCSTSDKEIINS